MLFATIGLYGVIGYMVTRRTREFGVRIALGARPQQVVGLVIRQGLIVVGAGALLGGVVALGAAVALSSHGVSPGDPLAWGVASTASLDKETATESPL